MSCVRPHEQLGMTHGRLEQLATGSRRYSSVKLSGLCSSSRDIFAGEGSGNGDAGSVGDSVDLTVLDGCWWWWRHSGSVVSGYGGGEWRGVDWRNWLEDVGSGKKNVRNGAALYRRGRGGMILAFDCRGARELDKGSVVGHRRLGVEHGARVKKGGPMRNTVSP